MRAALLLAVAIFSVQVCANSPAGDGLAKDFEQTKKNLEEQEVKQRRTLSALYQINKKIKKSVNKKGDLLQQRAFVEGSIESLSGKVNELEGQLKKQKTTLAERLRAIYQLGGPSLMRLFLGTGSSSDMDRNLKIMGIIAAKDIDLIKDYTRDVNDLETKRSKLAGRLEKLKTLALKISREEANLVGEQNLKTKILSGIRRNKVFAVNKMAFLREKSLQYNIEDAGIFDMLFRPSFSDQKGQLIRPTEGLITRRFGLEKSNQHSYTINHKGIFIGGKADQSIKSIFEGTVSFAGTLPGFGKTLIIDHGDHYYSVYSHASEIKVQVGEEVSLSQVIATVGYSPRDSKDGLYFEIRHFSEPYDPQQWMKGFNL